MGRKLGLIAHRVNPGLVVFRMRQVQESTAMFQADVVLATPVDSPVSLFSFYRRFVSPRF
jgi:hypothetical protein